LDLTSSKNGRLAIIVAVAAVVVTGFAFFNRRTASNADDEAHAFARSVYDQLKTIESTEVDDLAAQAAIAGWQGTEPPFSVEGRIPERVTEIASGHVARYRIRSSGTERCVDALWPHDGAFAVDVNLCVAYARP